MQKNNLDISLPLAHDQTVVYHIERECCMEKVVWFHFFERRYHCELDAQIGASSSQIIFWLHPVTPWLLDQTSIWKALRCIHVKSVSRYSVNTLSLFHQPSGDSTLLGWGFLSKNRWRNWASFMKLWHELARTCSYHRLKFVRIRGHLPYNRGRYQ